MEKSLDIRNTDLTKRIMRRVYLISVIRLTLHPTTMKVVLAALLFFRSMKYVSYEHVLTNMAFLPNLSAGLQFAKGAMFHAHPMTLVLLSSVAWLAVWAAADTYFRKQESWL
jgi:hypothetical protein